MGPVTNPERNPQVLDCTSGGRATVELITPRDVPLGGPRAMTVRRTLPSRSRSLIGAWCFLDHYGPDDVAETGGMKVAPHPHIGLQTVSWLFTGEIEHRDSAGNHAIVRPGEVNLMTGGRGISHSEISSDDHPVLRGAQLWTALPDSARDTEPRFDHYVPPEITGEGWAVRVFLGSLLGSTSPVETFTPLLGAELLLEAGATLSFALDPAFEHGVLVDTGGVAVRVDGGILPSGGEATMVVKDVLAYTAPGAMTMTVQANESTRLLLLGGPPFGESIVMWWNFIGRTHEEIVEARDAWQAAITDASSGAVVPDSQLVSASQFGTVLGDHLPPIPAPPLPNLRLRSRR
ncbi:pirin family protein [Nocardioides sp. Kera G14]|uniref:pirin family protein n=1 Tax=Nocardioides sp. Kera G14 TaxID=2884264 RepID=UPI001D11D19C|nr:pirin family protein [Nocardioides sp. Kera G14]UDY23946.1 pirin family protein [Nocardioides sp. Kera G14]